jgi:hypothetical protein
VASIYFIKTPGGSQPYGGHSGGKLAARRVQTFVNHPTLYYSNSGITSQNLVGIQWFWYNSNIQLNIWGITWADTVIVTVSPPTVAQQLLKRAPPAGNLKGPAGGAFSFLNSALRRSAMAEQSENGYLAIRISPKLRAQLERQATRRGIKGTELIRMLVINYIDAHSREDQVEVS